MVHYVIREIVGWKGHLAHDVGKLRVSLLHLLHVS